jgi:hypothetical protein
MKKNMLCITFLTGTLVCALYFYVFQVNLKDNILFKNTRHSERKITLDEAKAIVFEAMTQKDSKYVTNFFNSNPPLTIDFRWAASDEQKRIHEIYAFANGDDSVLFFFQVCFSGSISNAERRAARTEAEAVRIFKTLFIERKHKYILGFPSDVRVEIAEVIWSPVNTWSIWGKTIGRNDVQWNVIIGNDGNIEDIMSFVICTRKKSIQNP